MLCEVVVFKYQLVQIIFIGLTPLLIKHINVPQCIEKFGHIVKLDVYFQIKFLFTIDFLQIFNKVFCVMNYVWLGNICVDRHLYDFFSVNF